MMRRLPGLVIGIVLMTGCSAATGPGPAAVDPVGTSRAPSCKAGDRRIADESACLQDDAACYRLADGGWCTGPRGIVCPAGSTALPAATPCPVGATCIGMGESLTCLIGG